MDITKSKIAERVKEHKLGKNLGKSIQAIAQIYNNIENT